MSRSIVVQATKPVDNPETVISHSPIKHLAASHIAPRSSYANNALEVIEERAEVPEGVGNQSTGQLNTEDDKTHRKRNLRIESPPDEYIDPVQQNTVRLVRQMVEPRYQDTRTGPVRYYSRSPEIHRPVSQHVSTAPRTTTNQREQSAEHRNRTNGNDFNDIDDEISKVKKQLEESKRLLENYKSRGEANKKHS